ncbi:MAG: hypothetical protein P8Z68_04565 [Kineosporiaceae bacterium]|jgi:hypothetical protein
MVSLRMPRPRALIPAAVVVALAVAAVGGVLVTGSDPEVRVQAKDLVPTITAEQLTRDAGVRVYFGHQSVGMNVLEGVPAVYAAQGVAAPEVSQDSVPATGEAGDGFFVHTYIGENGDPAGKVAAFDATVRGGMGEQVDVALMKLCYVDFTSDTDVDALFATYRDTMAALQTDYPDVVFLHSTAPLTTALTGSARWKFQVKEMLGRTDDYGATSNVVRERYNALIRAEYGDHVFDIAAVESTQPDGTRIQRTHDGATYYTLDDGYASDIGHLNAEGSAAAATALLALVARTGG